MGILRRKQVSALALIFLSGLALAACGGVQLFAAQPEPTPLPTVTQSGAVSAEGRIMPLRSAVLSFATGGEIAELVVSEGDTVAAGDPLVRLGHRDSYAAALAQAELAELSARQALDELNELNALARDEAGQELAAAQLALTEAQKAFNDLDTDDYRDDLDDRRIAVRDAREALEDAQEELDEYADLDPDNPTRENAQTTLDNAQRDYDDAVYERDVLQNQLHQARAALDMARSRLEDAQRRYDARQDGPDPDELALAQARLDSAAAQVAAAREALEDLELAAPYAGMVVDLHDLEPGENVTPGTAVVTLADFSAWVVESRDLTELDVVDVEVGQPVEVIPDALPDLAFAGEVESIGRAFTERSGDILYTVRVRLDDSDPRLRWGMTVTLTFEP